MLDLLTPARCGGCGALLVRRPAPAPQRAWPPMLAPAARGGLPAWCEHCRDRWGAVPGAWLRSGAQGCDGWAAAVYAGRVRRAVLLAKRGAPEAARALLLARLPAEPPGGRPAWVGWVPAHPMRAIAAPDAGRVLARAVAAAWEVPCVPVLRRSPLARRQAQLTDEQRRSDPQRLGLRALTPPAGPGVIVDDVRTTGATLDHAASLLRAAGAESVRAIVLAASPRKTL